MAVIAPDPAAAGMSHADYWHSVGHVIKSVGTVTQTGGTRPAPFLSAQAAGAPRFRLTDTAVGPRRLYAVFEVQPPGGKGRHAIAHGDSTKFGG